MANKLDMTNRNARVGIGIGATLSRDNYQSIKPYVYTEVDVFIDEDANEVFEWLKEELLSKLDYLVAELDAEFIG